MIKQINTFGFALTSLLLPIAPKLVTIGLALVILTNIIGQPKPKFSQLNWKSLPAGWMVVFYLIHLIGIGYTENMVDGAFDLQVKLSYLILPLAFWLYPIQSNQTKALQKGFVAGLLLISLWSLINSSFAYLTDLDVLHFYGGSFIQHMHRGYFALYVLLGLGMLAVGSLDTTPIKQGKLIKSVIGIILVITLFLTNAKMALIIGLLLAIFIGIQSLLKAENKMRNGLLLGLALIIAIGAAISSPQIRGRFEMAWEAFQEKDHIDKTEVASTHVRILIWQSAWELITEAPIAGYGTGDIKDVLRAQNKSHGFTGAVERNLNPHNQYLQTGIALGLLGLIPLIGGILISIVRAFTTRDRLTGLLYLIITLAMLTESILEVHAGVMFAAIFCTVLPRLQR